MDQLTQIFHHIIGLQSTVNIVDINIVDIIGLQTHARTNWCSNHPNISQLYLVGGFNPSEKYEFVNWDDEIPNIWENKIHVPNHQPGNRNPRYLPHYDTTQGQLQEHMAVSTVA